MTPRVTVVIPTWRNAPYLELCLRSVRERSAAEHEVVVHVNEAREAELAQLQKGNTRFTWTHGNVGVSGANQAAELATTPWIYYLNDDMYVLPGWDSALLEFVGEHSLEYACSTAVEPFGWVRGGCAVRGEYGRGLKGFREADLLRDCESLKRPGAVVAGAWPPHIMSKRLWDELGGFSEAYDELGGVGTDADLAWRLHKKGIPMPGVRSSLVYHFATRTTRRVPSRGLAGRRDGIFLDTHGADRRGSMKSLGRGREWATTEK